MAQDPLVNANILGQQPPLTLDDHNILVVGQMTTGTATDGQLIEGVLTEKNANDSFGRDSQIAKGLRRIIRRMQSSTIRPTISAIGKVDAGGATAATATIVFAGTSTEAGSLEIVIDSVEDGTYEIDVANGDTATQIGDKLVAAITANLNSPVTAANVTGTVTLTAVNAGTQGNTIGIKNTGTVAGVTVTVAAKLAGGATDPSTTGLFDVVTDKRYQSVLYPAEWGVTALTDFLEPRFNADNKILDGVGFVCETDTFANLNATLDGFNSGQGFRTLAYLPNKLVDRANLRGGAIFENPYTIAAEYVTIRGLRLTENSNIANITVNGISRGGFFMAAIPYHNTPFSLPVIDSQDKLLDEEEKELIASGGLVLTNNKNNTGLLSRSGITTYKLDDQGNKDNSFKFLNFVDSQTIAREYMFSNAKFRDFAQSALTDSEEVVSPSTYNAELVLGVFMGYYETLAKDKRYTIFRAGNAPRQAFKRVVEETITINLTDGKVNLDAINQILSQVREVTFNLILSLD
jgi:phage tail sheath gpL-like